MTSRRSLACALAALLLGCTPSALPDAGGSDAPANDAGNDAGPSLASCAPLEAEVVRFTTDDGVELEADLHRPAEGAVGAAVLLHMIPPSNDRTNYPRALVDALVERCVTVLNVDRRGAGGSAGVARDAYEGPSGVLDARAAVAYLLALEAGAPAPDRVAIVGASNGTTTLLDYAALTLDEASLAPPAALVFLSGGSYTENQTSLSRLFETDIPTLLAYPGAERVWNETQQLGAPAGWSFREFTPGAHGTQLFGSNPEAIEEVAAFVGAALLE